MAKKNFAYFEKEDYDLSVRMGQTSLGAYSSGRIDQLRPEGNYRLAGEMVWGKSRKSRAGLSFYAGDEGPLPLAPYKTYSRLFYRSLGFVAVAGTRDRYVELLTPRRSLCLMSFLALLTLVSSVLTFLFIGIPQASGGTAYLRPDREANSVPMGGRGKAPVLEEGGGCVTMAYQDEVSLCLASRDLTFYFANPGQSTHDALLQIVIEREGKELVIAESGLIQRGYSLGRLPLKEEIEMAKGSYDARFNVDYYDAVTGEKALLRSHIPVTIDVD